MIETAIDGLKELGREIWQVDEKPQDVPPWAQAASRFADRLSNIGVVLLYAVLVAYAVVLAYRFIPPQWMEKFSGFGQKFWFWMIAAGIIIAALRLGLGATKALKRWRISSLLASFLLFDFLLKTAPPLFGAPGFSPVDQSLSVAGNPSWLEVFTKALGF